MQRSLFREQKLRRGKVLTNSTRASRLNRTEEAEGSVSVNLKIENVGKTLQTNVKEIAAAGTFRGGEGAVS